MVGSLLCASALILVGPSSLLQVAHENKRGHTALSWATVKDRTRQMEALIRRGAEVNYQGRDHAI